MNKVFFMVGLGKIVIGLLYPCFKNQMNNDVVFICGVRGSDEWINRRNSFSSIKSTVISSDNKTIFEDNWLFSKAEETFSEFIERCHKNNCPGIWVFEDEDRLREALDQSFIVATSVGIEGLDSLFNRISRLGFQKPIYAFENQPIAVNKIAEKYDALRVIHCPIDCVVVSREFRDDFGGVVVKLGLDPSKTIMIYDKERNWKELFIPIENSVITITENAESLKSMLNKKQYGKNVPHKLACQLAVKKKNPRSVKEKPLCQVINKEEIQTMKQIKPAIIVPAFIAMMSNQPMLSMKKCMSEYESLSAYYDEALNTVITDQNDTIGRIIHLNNDETADNDKQRLIDSLVNLKSMLSKPLNLIIKNFLEENIINSFSYERIEQTIDDIINRLSE